MTPKTKRAFWLIGGILIVAAFLWLDHDPTASIGSRESVELRRSELESQITAVFEEEEQLAKGSVNLNEQVPDRVSEPLIFSIKMPTASRETSRTLGSEFNQISPSSSVLVSDQDVGLRSDNISGVNQPAAESADKDSSDRAALEFDLNYLLTPAEPLEMAKKESPASKLENQSEQWVNVTIKAGDSLSSIFKRLGLEPQLAIKIARQNDGEILNKLRLGPHLKILRRGREFLGLRYQRDLLTILSAKQNGTQINLSTVRRKFDVTERSLTGVVKSSLFESGINDGISLDLLYNLSSIFQWRIDFNRDLRPGDRYSLIFEERWLDGKKFSSGPILAAEFIVDGNAHRAIRHVNENGSAHYFTPDGESLEGLFLRSPMRISRVTSTFSNKRFHPVLKKWRPHKGVDYGGRIGDAVMATGDGVVTFAGHKGHYGRVIIIQHGKKYSTLYAHLSRFSKAIRSGQNVTQGQVIGYVGSSGLTTGPHLHYEFRVDGVHKNPLTVKLPRSFAIARQARTEFLERARAWSRRLNRLTAG